MVLTERRLTESDIRQLTVTLSTILRVFDWRRRPA